MSQLEGAITRLIDHVVGDPQLDAFSGEGGTILRVAVLVVVAGWLRHIPTSRLVQGKFGSGSCWVAACHLSCEL